MSMITATQSADIRTHCRSLGAKSWECQTVMRVLRIPRRELDEEFVRVRLVDNAGAEEKLFIAEPHIVHEMYFPPVVFVGCQKRMCASFLKVRIVFLWWG